MFFTARGMLGLALAGSGLAASHREAGATVHVWTYNYAGAAPETVAKAQQEASRILNRTGVTIEWVDCPRTAVERDLFPLCRLNSPLRPVVLSVFSRRPPGELASSPHVSGRAHLDENGNGFLADVYIAGAGVQADASPSQRASILGHLIAHELGHIFLASSTHSRRGIPDPAHLEKSRVAEHLDVAYPLRNLAAVRYAQRGYPEAEALLQRAISIQQKVLGPRHLASLTVCRSMQKCFASGSKRQRSSSSKPTHCYHVRPPAADLRRISDE